MKTKSVSVFVGVMLFCGLSMADMKVHITYDRGAVIDAKNPSVRDDALVLQQGTLSFSRISRMEFEFGDGLTAQKCETLFNEGSFDQLEKSLAVALKPAASFVRLPGNLDVYLTWQMKVQFWTGKYAEMSRTAELLRQRNAQPSGLAGMYAALALIEQGRTGEAAKVFTATGAAEANPMALFVRARLAMAKQEYRQALQYLARIVVTYNQDPEWMPAATLYEGLVYKQTSSLEASGNIAKELIEKYPNGYWHGRAAELK